MTVILMTVFAAVMGAQQVAAGVQTPVPKPAGASAQTVSTVPRLSAAVIAELQALAKDKSKLDFILLSFDGPALHIRSNRSLIAFSTADAMESGGRFTVPSSLAPDIVTISCGESKLGGQGCNRIAVSVKGRPVKALSYASGPKAYQNAMGARWTIAGVEAAYSATDLRVGFTVDYSFGSTAWTREVTADEAKDTLLMLVGMTAK